ncbi:hypothetical protein H4R34_004041 [Dimargaris verticillata]|uniref:Uncharacterized protein n=1 Tax=Dimargaris verticillata TaxID=2761393 RepID=A0A9W8EBH8_9FUNG|nr:hypothetical protein H4R34_004041 [Dimargaris verticillata]
MLVYAGDIIQQAKEPQSNQGMPRAAAAQHLSEEVEFFNRYCDQLVVSLESLKQRIPPSAASASNHASATSQPPSDAMAVDAPNAKVILQKALLEN